MTDKKKPRNINIVDLARKREEIQEEQNKTPEFVLNKLELLLKKAKEGKLNIAVIHFGFEEEDEQSEEEPGGTMIWDKKNNILEILGLIEVMKSVAMQGMYSDCYDIEDE